MGEMQAKKKSGASATLSHLRSFDGFWRLGG